MTVRYRERNKIRYRIAHWPIWIWVFFLTPGPLIFNLFERGGEQRLWIWLGLVLLGTGVAGLLGQLPGVEPKPYIIRFTEDKPNPQYRKVCYTFAWNALVNYALLNLAGLVWAVSTQTWRLKQIYEFAYFPILGVFIVLTVFGILPRCRRSTAGEGVERRYFYGAVWAIVPAQFALWPMWKKLPRTWESDVFKLLVYVGILLAIGILSYRGILPRTRPILTDEVAAGF
jgi:hypothetical protein